MFGPLGFKSHRFLSEFFFGTYFLNPQPDFGFNIHTAILPYVT